MKVNDIIGSPFYYEHLFHFYSEFDGIYIRKDKYGERESITSNEQFGRDRSRCFKSEKLALEYFDILTLKLYQGVSKSIAGVQQNVEVISELHFEEICEPCY
jgi:hypothetical protein